MADNRILTANFRLSRRVKTASLYQYDYGQMLRFLGVCLPNTYEVHFSGSESGGEAVTVLGNAEGVTIPDALLATGNTIHAWIFLHDAQTDGETEYKVEIPVIRRPKVTDAEPTPVQQDIITQTIAALNAGVERAETLEDEWANMSAQAETLPEGSDATATYSGGVLTIGVPTGATGAKGDKGDPGAKGDKGDTGATGATGPQGEPGRDGQDGQQGRDGQDGAPGQDGVSPTISVTDITGGHRVTITDATGQHSFDVMNGEGGAVQDVQVNGASVLSDGVANVPVAGVNRYGTVMVKEGLYISNDGYLYTNRALETQIKQGVNEYSPIVSGKQHYSVYYALAKVAGADMKSVSGETVGVYPEAQKSAISEMLNSPVTVSGSTPTITALSGIQYVCGEVATLDITLPASGCVDVVFESGSTPTVLTITPPNGVTLKWANGFDPTALDANTTYEINIADGLGVAGQWT